MRRWVRRSFAVAVLLAATSVRAQSVSLPAPERPNPISTVAIAAGTGGVAGLLMGGGAALIEGDHVGRDLAIGGGLGVIFGALFGVVQAYHQQSATADRRPADAPLPPAALARDGANRTDRDPIRGRQVFALGFQF